MSNLQKFTKALKNAGGSWNFAKCSICNYQMSYLIADGRLCYDNGCDCSKKTLNLREVPEDEIDFYFMVNNKRVLEFIKNNS